MKNLDIGKIGYYYTIHFPTTILFCIILYHNLDLVGEVGWVLTILVSLVFTFLFTICFFIGPLLVGAVKTVSLIGLMFLGVFMVTTYWHQPELRLSKEIYEAAHHYGVSPWWILLSWIVGPIDFILLANSDFFD